MRNHIVAAIRAHAESEYPRESCGLLLAIGRRHVYLPCINSATNKEEEFRISAQQYADAEDSGQIIGVVHSHPDATSRPSNADIAQCEVSGLPWHIISWPEGDIRTVVPTGEIPPLVGRPFVHGAWDCYAIIRDWYRINRGVTLPDYQRKDYWWEQGENLYLDHYREAGFAPVADSNFLVGDVILMQIQSPQVNHAAVYLGDNRILHHLFGRLSGVDVWGGYWAERARLVVRYQGQEAWVGRARAATQMVCGGHFCTENWWGGSVSEQVRTQDRYILRFPQGDMRQQLKARAALNRRSLNAEILHLLECGLKAEEKSGAANG